MTFSSMKKEAAASFKMFVNNWVGLYGVIIHNITICVHKWLIFIKYLKSIQYKEATSLEFLHCWHSTVLASTVCILHLEEHDETWFYIKRNGLMTL
jgi:hypothetical protein